jgi:hypothetical protein
MELHPCNSKRSTGATRLYLQDVLQFMLEQACKPDKDQDVIRDQAELAAWEKVDTIGLRHK